MLIFVLLSSSPSVSFNLLQAGGTPPSAAPLPPSFPLSPLLLLLPFSPLLSTRLLLFSCTHGLFLSTFISFFIFLPPGLSFGRFFSSLHHFIFLAPAALVTTPVSSHHSSFDFVFFYKMYSSRLDSDFFSVSHFLPSQAYILHMGEERWRAPLSGQI